MSIAAMQTNAVADFAGNALNQVLQAGPAATAGISEEMPFASLFQDAMHNVQQLEQKASDSVQGLLDGSGVDVHTAMLATGAANTAFELALAVRGKAVAAYQQIMSTQF